MSARLTHDRLAAQYGIAKDEARALEDFIAHVRGTSPTALAWDYEFEMETAGSACGTSGCVAHFVWQHVRAQIESVSAFPLDPKLHPLAVSPMAYAIGHIWKRAPILRRLFHMTTASGTEGDMSKCSDTMVADAVERVLCGEEPWPTVAVPDPNRKLGDVHTYIDAE